MKKILLTHPDLIGIVDRIQEKSSSIIVGSLNYKEVIAMAEVGCIEKLGIVFEAKGISTLDFIKKIYTIDPVLPVLAWDCSPLYFDELGDYPELLEDHIFYINSKELKGDFFFEIFDKFFSENLTSFDFIESP